MNVIALLVFIGDFYFAHHRWLAMDRRQSYGAALNIGVLNYSDRNLRVAGGEIVYVHGVAVEPQSPGKSETTATRAADNVSKAAQDHRDM